MRNRIIGGIAAIWGAIVVISGLLRGGSQAEGDYTTGQIRAMVFGALLFLIGMYYLIKGNARRRISRRSANAGRGAGVSRPAGGDIRLVRVDRSLVTRVQAMAKPRDQFGELVTALIEQNPHMTQAEPPDSQAHRAIAAIALLNIEVQNGGLIQFFWNRPQWAEHVSPALRLVGADALADQYDKAVEQLAEGIDGFVRHRERGDVDDFAAAARDQDLEWFDRLYFGEFDRTTDRWSGLVELSTSVLSRSCSQT